MVQQFLLLAAFALSVVRGNPCHACPPDISNSLVAQTKNGAITGHIAPNTSCVVEYLGIPYAKPPTGKLRFAAPEAPTSEAPFEAASYGFDCPLSPSPPTDYPGFTPQAQRIIEYFASAAGTPQSEDCLTLNIWQRPSVDKSGVLKPVLVFFHGGRFAIGNTNSPFYTGKYFAQAEDIVVVTVTYRLNIFGFPGAPGETQNLGLLDQRAAVEWLRDNAEAYGGDPSKITISGQSSGGVAVDYWTYAYQEDPIVHGIIATSGNAFSFPVNSPGVPERNWDTVVDAVGCGNATEVMDCMREIDWKDVKAAAVSVRPSGSSSVLRSIPPFYPMPDEKTVFSDYVSRTEAGDFSPLPVLMGHNNNEDGYYRIPAYRNGVVPTDEQVRSFLLESFTCPVSFQAEARRANNVPAFGYRYFADWDNTRLYPTSGAYHGVDLHMVFGASEDTSGLPPSKEQKRLTRVMQRMWAAFSDDPTSGLTDALGWPLWDSENDTLALLGKNNSAEVEFVKPETYDAPCSTVVMGALATGSSG
ncbi:Alpha/Beta hydrolase protein [Emericellopsis atlantica]|uniref:Alpha/Beta hydrolase protein n=1 Tax=Emericellopsis atlantica TaxID=2614577 RepID=A0A9P7ZPU5_9HYPO|nr:Alpha/Beta hydrolase protein [Emericellopsis atlantica]KAG9255636.1 Alpha/Beta hydrolase protein [Emericellopsis atlantica]